MQKKTYVPCEIVITELCEKVLSTSDGNMIVSGDGIKWPGMWSEVSDNV